MNKSEQAIPVTGIDETIGRIEDLYQKMTGTAVPTGDAVYAPIPVERDPAEHVEEQLNRLMGMLDQWATPYAVSPAWIPRISVSESPSEIVIEADLPGVGRDHVTVTVQGNALVVSGSRPAPHETGMQHWQNERPLGPFRRVVMIPGMRTGEPAAQMKDGVLEIRVQKDTQAVKPRQILVTQVN
jgi:HSP20 family protein